MTTNSNTRNEIELSDTDLDLVVGGIQLAASQLNPTLLKAVEAIKATIWTQNSYTGVN
jgi:hypothetical protein